MAVESRFSTDRRILFSEPFTPASVAANGGIVTGGVSLETGVATFDGTGNNKILYDNESWAQSTKLSFRIKTSNIDDSAFRVLFGTHYTDIEVSVDSADVKVYLGYDNVAFWLVKSIAHNISDLIQRHEFVLTVDETVLKLYVDGVYQGQETYPTGWVRQANGVQWSPCLGIRNDGNTSPLIGDEELFEVYQGILTSEEISLLHDNKLYKGFVNENLVLFADYTRGTSRNLAREYSDTVVTNGTFDSGVSGWTSSFANIVWNSDEYCEMVGTGGTVRISQVASLVVGKRYRLTFKAKSILNLQPYFHAAHWSDIVYTVRPHYSTDWQVYEFFGTALNVNFHLYLGTLVLGEQVDIDNISVQEVLESIDTNTNYLHNIGLYCNGTTKVEYGTAYAITGDWSLEIVGEVTGASLSQFAVGINTAEAGFFVEVSNRWGFRDGASNKYAEATQLSGNNHLVITKTGTSYRFYRAGKLVGTATALDVDITQIRVGNRGDGLKALEGNIAYVREYTSVLSAENVAQNYQYAVDRGYLNG